MLIPFSRLCEVSCSSDGVLGEGYRSHSHREGPLKELQPVLGTSSCLLEHPVSTVHLGFEELDPRLQPPSCASQSTTLHRVRDLLAHLALRALPLGEQLGLRSTVAAGALTAGPSSAGASEQVRVNLDRTPARPVAGRRAQGAETAEAVQSC
jgi:hypothetical protein